VSADEAFDDQYEVADGLETSEADGPAAKRLKLDNNGDGDDEDAAETASVYDFAAAERLRCRHCGEEFGAAWSLTVHMRTRHPLERSHHCRSCNKNFATLLDLQQHQLVHQVSRR
jgi:Zinc finger, C2H2 type